MTDSHNPTLGPDDEQSDDEQSDDEQSDDEQSDEGGDSDVQPDPARS